MAKVEALVRKTSKLTIITVEHPVDNLEREQVYSKAEEIFPKLLEIVKQL